VSRGKIKRREQGELSRKAKREESSEEKINNPSNLRKAILITLVTVKLNFIRIIIRIDAT
jgi:hypothetical protein